MALRVPSIAKCVKAIDTPTFLWKGNCHSIADALLNAGLFPACRTAYGHYFGPVNPDGYFGHRHGGIPPRHGWLIHRDGTIYDPTLWVFLDCLPYIGVAAVGSREYDYYDLGGERVYAALGRDVPPTLEELTQRGDFWLQPSTLAWPSQCWPLLDRLYGTHEALLWGYVYHLANRGPAFLGEDAAAIYVTIIRANKSVWIPIDYRKEVLAPEESPDGRPIETGEDVQVPKRTRRRVATKKRPAHRER